MKRVTTTIAVACMCLLAGACSSYNANESSPRDDRDREAQSTVEVFKQTRPSAARFLTGSAGYAVFPKITKGAAGLGGAHGHGVLYDHGRIVGDATVAQGTIGAQLGGQMYSEIVFFQNDYALNEFKAGNMQFDAQATAVAASEGAGANADYSHGVAVFTTDQKGLMFEASIGGQKFSYTPRN